MTKHCIPPGPVRLRHDAATFELVTIQHRDVVETARRSGVVYPRLDTSDYVDLPDFALAYRWLAGRLGATRRCNLGFDPRHPAMFWCWARTRRATLVAMSEASGKDFVLVRARIARDRVLLSDFNLWHGPLNGGVAHTADEYARLEAAAEIGDDYATDLEVELEQRHGRSWRAHRLSSTDRQRVETTWSAILLDDPSQALHVQACVSHLELADIVDVSGLDRSTTMAA